jgi:hypothetical protein
MGRAGPAMALASRSGAHAAVRKNGMWASVRTLRMSAPMHNDEAPVPGNDVGVSPKVRGLVDDIAKLTLLEVAELCTVLKVRLCACGCS